MSIRKIAVMSMFLALSLIIFIFESYIPPIVPIAGVKLGLANMITLIAMIVIGRKEAFIILILRIFMGGIFTGNTVAIIYSLSGGVLCFFIEALIVKKFEINQVWVVSIIGAVVHNMGQIAAAVFITGTIHIVWYMTILALSGIICGAVTGVCAVMMLKHSKGMIEKLYNETIKKGK